MMRPMSEKWPEGEDPIEPQGARYDVERAAGELLERLTEEEAEGGCIGTVAEEALRAAYRAGAQRLSDEPEPTSAAGPGSLAVGSARELSNLRAEVDRVRLVVDSARELSRSLREVSAVYGPDGRVAGWRQLDLARLGELVSAQSNLEAALLQLAASGEPDPTLDPAAPKKVVQDAWLRGYGAAIATVIRHPPVDPQQLRTVLRSDCVKLDEIERAGLIDSDVKLLRYWLGPVRKES
jgi:hypothetical protein